MNAEEKRAYNLAWRERNPNYFKDWVKKNRVRNEHLSKIWKKNNPDKVKAAYKRWRESHTEQEAIRFKKWYEENRLRLLKRKADERRANPEVVHARDKRSYDRNKSNPEFIRSNRARVKAYTKFHPESKNHFCHKRRAAIRGNRIGKESDIRKFIARIRKSKRVSCYYCGKRFPGRSVHFDHVIPIARGGAHEIGNLCCACRDCNITKGARLPSEFVVNGQPRLSL